MLNVHERPFLYPLGSWRRPTTLILKHKCEPWLDTKVFHVPTFHLNTHEGHSNSEKLRTSKVEDAEGGRAVEGEGDDDVAPGGLQPNVLPKGSEYDAPLQAPQRGPQRQQQQQLAHSVAVRRVQRQPPQPLL